MRNIEAVQSSIHPLPDENCVPENNLIEQHLSNFYYFTGLVTSMSSLRNCSAERSLHTRRVRQELLSKYNKMGKNSREERRTIFHEAHKRDNIASQFLQQKEIAVNMGDLGTQKSRIVEMTPQLNTSEESIKTAILIGGISNDLDPIGGLAQEIAYSGRRVVVIGYPESTMGNVSKEFAAEVEKRNDFSLHAKYFIEASKHITKINKIDSFELWSHSTGGPIAAIMLNNKKFRKSVENGIFLSPASVIEQSKENFYIGMMSEMIRVLKIIPELSKYSLVQPRRGQDSKEKKQVSSILLDAIQNKYDNWKDIKVNTGGKVIFWSGEKDAITHTANATKLGCGDNQYIIRDPDGTHVTALINPRKIISQIDNNLRDD